MVMKYLKLYFSEFFTKVDYVGYNAGYEHIDICSRISHFHIILIGFLGGMFIGSFISYAIEQRFNIISILITSISLGLINFIHTLIQSIKFHKTI